VSSYALSADVSGTVDLVSSQSANWGGSALALSAGPGISLTLSGNTLVASTDETVLWEGTATDSCTISEAFSNFEKIRLTLDDASNHKATEVIIEPTSSTNWPVNIPYGNSIVGGIVFLHIALSGTTLSVSKAKMMCTVYDGNDASWSNYNDESLKNALLKVVGINRTAGA
jgi:hypothetical protein